MIGETRPGYSKTGTAIQLGEHSRPVQTQAASVRISCNKTPSAAVFAATSVDGLIGCGCDVPSIRKTFLTDAKIECT